MTTKDNSQEISPIDQFNDIIISQSRVNSFLKEDRIQFYKNFLHDLNSQARTVKTFCQIIDSNKELSHESNEYLAFIEEAGERLYQLSQVMSKFLDQERHDLCIRRVNMSDALTSVLFKLEDLIKDKNVEIYTEDLDRSKEFFADSLFLEEVLFEVIKNAIVHQTSSNKENHIHLKLESSDDETLIHIIDLGTPIPTDLTSKSMEYLTKLEDWKSSTGLGSGLAIAKQMLARMGGDIHINKFYNTTSGNCVTIKLRS